MLAIRDAGRRKLERCAFWVRDWHCEQIECAVSGAQLLVARDGGPHRGGCRVVTVEPADDQHRRRVRGAAGDGERVDPRAVAGEADVERLGGHHRQSDRRNGDGDVLASTIQAGASRTLYSWAWLSSRRPCRWRRRSRASATPLAVLAREVRAERAQIVVAELGRPKERHRVQAAAHDRLHEVDREIGALLELRGLRTLVARLQCLRTGHRGQIRRADSVLRDRGVARGAALLKHFAAALLARLLERAGTLAGNGAQAVCGDVTGSADPAVLKRQPPVARKNIVANFMRAPCAAASAKCRSGPPRECRSDRVRPLASRSGASARGRCTSTAPSPCP